MNLFNEINNKSNSYLLSSKGSSAAFRTCTPCCPFDTKNLPHPQINQSNTNVNEITSNSDACCLSKLQVDCRIQRHKKKNKRYDSIHSFRSTKRNRFGSNSHYMHNYDLTSSSSSSNESEQSEREYRYHNKSASLRNPLSSADAHQHSQSQLTINKNIQDLKTSIDNLTQLITHHENPPQSISFLDKLCRFFTSFKSSSKDLINEECCQILERNHLTKQNLLSIYHLFDKNETIFLSWLRTIMPEYFLPLLLNYVKHFDSISTDNE